jgi:hypothetical protein
MTHNTGGRDDGLFLQGEEKKNKMLSLETIFAICCFTTQHEEWPIGGLRFPFLISRLRIRRRGEGTTMDFGTFQKNQFG